MASSSSSKLKNTIETSSSHKINTGQVNSKEANQSGNNQNSNKKESPENTLQTSSLEDNSEITVSKLADLTDSNNKSSNKGSLVRKYNFFVQIEFYRFIAYIFNEKMEDPKLYPQSYQTQKTLTIGISI